MIKNILKNLFVTLLALLATLFIYLYVTDLHIITAYGIPYFIVISLSNSLLPFWIFLSVIDFVILKITKKNIGDYTLTKQMLVFLLSMFIIIGIMIAYDLCNSFLSLKERGLNYLMEYSIFILFTPFAVMIKYFLYRNG